MSKHSTKQQIIVFQQAGAARYKIAGIETFGRNLEIAGIYDIPEVLSEIIDEPHEYISRDFQGDLVLNFMKHPDLSEYLVHLCNEKGIPVIASGQHVTGAITPFTCCGLGRLPELGAYAECFGVPELDVEVEAGCISSVQVRRGASCGATWEVAEKIIGMEVEKALSAIGCKVQHICGADPSGFDPVSGRSPLHFAGDVHIAALRKALGRKDK